MVRIIAIRKSNGNHYDPNSAVEAYKWINESGNYDWSYRIDLAKWVKNGGFAYVWDSIQEKKIICEYRKNQYGTEYLQTVSDGEETNNLLELPEF